MSKGFFIPSSVSEHYVARQRTQGGGYRWDEAVDNVSLGQQAAIQNLNKEYSNTINNAYTNYLAANRGIRGSGMGQGYKDAYVQQAQIDQQTQIAQANLNSANVRNQINANANTQRLNIYEQYKAEAANMDRVSSTANMYLNYLKTLEKDGTNFLTPEQEGYNLDMMYDTIFDDELSAKIKNFTDDKGDSAKGYVEWMEGNLKDTEADRAWAQWFRAGGYQQFKDAKKRGIRRP